MRDCLNIIPTPKYLEYSKGSKLKFSTFYSDNNSVILKNAIAELEKVMHIVNVEECKAELIIYTDTKSVPQGLLTDEDLNIFNEKFADEQGYVIRRYKNRETIIVSQNPIGAAYGVMTLLQIINLDISEIIVRDYPDFGYRGCAKWLGGDRAF